MRPISTNPKPAPIATIPTMVVPRGGGADVEAIVAAEGWSHFVLKPAVSASGYETHALRTPLTVLRASVEDLLEDSTLTELQREAVGELQFQTQRLISITNTLLLLARADAGRLHADAAIGNRSFTGRTPRIRTPRLASGP